VANLRDFDRYIEEQGIPPEHYPAAFALWIAEQTGSPVPRSEKLEREGAGGRRRDRGRRPLATADEH
jgi:hypothetical protein